MNVASFLYAVRFLGICQFGKFDTVSHILTCDAIQGVRQRRNKHSIWTGSLLQDAAIFCRQSILDLVLLSSQRRGLSRLGSSQANQTRNLQSLRHDWNHGSSKRQTVRYRLVGVLIIEFLWIWITIEVDVHDSSSFQNLLQISSMTNNRLTLGCTLDPSAFFTCFLFGSTVIKLGRLFKPPRPRQHFLADWDAPSYQLLVAQLL